MKVLITGGTGFVGSNLASFLAKKGDNVTICDNNFRGKLDNQIKNIIEKYKIKYIECDLTDEKSLEKFEYDYDEIYHLAAINGTANFYNIPDQVLRVNTLIVLNLLQWAVNNNIKSKILFSSSSETYAASIGKAIPTPEDVHLCIDNIYNPRFSYAGSKIIGELMFVNYSKQYNLDTRIVRYHNIYGPRMGFEHVMPEFCLRAFLKKDPFAIHGSEQTRAFCYIDDAVRATCLVMRTNKLKNEIVNIGNSVETTIYDLAKMILKLAKYDPKIKEMDPPVGSTPRRCPDISKLFKLTNFKSEVDILSGLKKTFDWYKEYYENLS